MSKINFTKIVERRANGQEIVENKEYDNFIITTDIKFAKVKPSAKIPTKRQEDAGMDVYACFDEDYMIIMPHETKMIPTGIASSCSDDFMFKLEERGSTGTKGIEQRCGIIDSGFRGEWFAPLTNGNDYPIIISKKSDLKDTDLNVDLLNKTYGQVVIYPYEKAICQAMVIPVPRLNIEEISYEELQNIESDRGTGALGSSGK